MDEDIMIDIEQLSEDLKQEALGAFFGGGFGGALIEASDIDRASDQELVDMAERWGIDLSKYQVE